MQYILSRLPVKEAARTSVLSKSWLRAWSTIPTLRFLIGRGKSMKVVDMERTLTRYLRDNIPIERFTLIIDLESQEAASHAEKCVRQTPTKSLKEFYVSVDLHGFSFTLPGEILSGENLTKIRLSQAARSVCMMSTSQLPVVNCVSLQELHLDGVCISEELLDGILSSCRLLVTIVLIDSCKGFQSIKVQNLPRLREFRIALDARHQTALEISHVPNLGVFSYDLDVRFTRHERPVSIQPLLNIIRKRRETDGPSRCDHRERVSGRIQIAISLSREFDPSFIILDGGKLPSHECLHQTTVLDAVPIRAYRCASSCSKLLCFEISGSSLPGLSFPVSSLKQIMVSLVLSAPPVDADFFIRMREALTLARVCYLEISTHHNSELPLDIDIHDLRTRLLLPPARNVQRLTFETSHDECLWERSPFFDAFFEICHPRYVIANPDIHSSHNNHFCRLMLREVLQKKETTKTAYWTQYLKHVLVRQGPHQKWRTLTNSLTSILDGSLPHVYLHFKLIWRH